MGMHSPSNTRKLHWREDTVRYQPDKKHFKEIPDARRFETPYRSLQGRLSYNLRKQSSHLSSEFDTSKTDVLIAYWLVCMLYFSVLGNSG